MSITLLQLFVQFVVFILVFCILMPLLGAFLIHKGMQVLGLVDPPVPWKTDEKEKAADGKSGITPPRRADYYFCLKVVLSATFTTLVLMFALARVLPDSLVVKAAVSTVIESAVAIALLRRFKPAAILVVIAAALVVNAIAFSTMYMTVKLVVGEQQPPAREAREARVLAVSYDS
jgi:hypothetical protein